MTFRPPTPTLWLAAAFAAVGLWACGLHESSSTPSKPGSGSPGAFEGIDETEKNLTPLATACSWADSGVVTIVMAAGEYSLVGKTDAGILTVNGTPCGSATSVNTTRINITGSPDGGSETVILDYLNGPFAMGSSGAVGVNIDLKNGSSDAVKIRASSGVDTFLLATSALDAGSASTYAIAMGLNGSSPAGYKNITFNNVESLVVSTGPGADVIRTNGQADAGIGGTPFGRAGSGTGASLVIYGGVGDDTVEMGLAKGGLVTFNGGAGTADTIDFSLRTANLSVAIGGGAVCGESGENATVATDVEVVNGGSGADTLACEAVTACTLNGNGGADSLTGSAANDTLNGGAANDVIIAGLGNDTVSGGAGIDTLSYADRGSSDGGVSVTLGTGGAASSSNGDPSALLSDGGVNDGDTVDTVENVVGTSGADTIHGNDLDNQLTGGPGDDWLYGGAGNDTFLMAASAATCGNDTIDGESGEDTVSYVLRSQALTLSLTNPDGGVITTGNGESGENGTFTNVENLICGGGNDTVTGDANNNVIEGGAGNDTIDSAAGDDIIDPGAGTNGVTCGAGNDILLPGGTTSNSANDCEG